MKFFACSRPSCPAIGVTFAAAPAESCPINTAVAPTAASVVAVVVSTAAVTTLPNALPTAALVVASANATVASPVVVAARLRARCTYLNLRGWVSRCLTDASVASVAVPADGSPNVVAPATTLPDARPTKAAAPVALTNYSIAAPTAASVAAPVAVAVRLRAPCAYLHLRG